MPCFDGVGNYSQSSTPRPRPSSLVLIVEIIGYPEQGDQIWRNFKGLWQFEKGLFSIFGNLWTYFGKKIDVIGLIFIVANAQISKT